MEKRLTKHYITKVLTKITSRNAQHEIKNNKNSQSLVATNVFFFYIQTLFAGRPALRYLKTDHEVLRVPILKSLLTDNPPSPGGVANLSWAYWVFG